MAGTFLKGKDVILSAGWLLPNPPKNYGPLSSFTIFYSYIMHFIFFTVIQQLALA